MVLTEEELNKALLDCYGDKALGFDGMTMAFLKSNWNLVKTNVMMMFSEAFSLGKLVSSLNATLLASF